MNLWNKDINYLNDTEKGMLLEISNDQSSLFFANKYEIFFIEIIRGVSVKQMLSNNKHDIIRHIYPDPVNLKAFYYICGTDYSKNILIQHTHNKAFHFKVACQLEPEMFKIYDVVIFPDQFNYINSN